MRKKYTDETYLKGVSKCNIKTQKLDEENAYIVIKEIIDIDEPFLKRVTLIDNGFYVIEYTPLDSLYNARAFLDNQLNTISYYFDISLGNGVENGRPYYDDLYLDIVYGVDTDKQPKVLDEDELKIALATNMITQEQYDLANNICNQLLQEIRENKNKFINMDKKSIIRSIKKNEIDNRF